MSEYLEFVGNHPFLFIAAGVLLVMIIVSELRRSGRGFRSADPQTAIVLTNRDAQLVDTRSVEAFRKAHILNAKNIPLAELEDKLGKLDNARPVIVYCDTGVTSQRAAALLVKQGFTEVYNLQGGLANWQRENLPVVKEK
ncbi:MAG: rhodanese-like domain-containing protein [Gammaproteobacteria bacterium]|nr:rhodanese-like domain-containing protein [Gammaproteobacteria bacterium]